MKKTAAQPQIRPQKKIKIPEQLIKMQKKSINDHNFFNNLDQPPIITKRELLLEAMGIEKSVRKRAESRKQPTVSFQPKKSVQIQVVKQFQTMYEEHNVKKSVSSQKFKITMTGAGFRKRGKSVSTLRNSAQTIKPTLNKKPQTSQEYKKQPSEQQEDNLNIIKAYYSAKVDRQKQQQKQIKKKLSQQIQINDRNQKDVKLYSNQSRYRVNTIEEEARLDKRWGIGKMIVKVEQANTHVHVHVQKTMLQELSMSDAEEEEIYSGKFQDKFKLRGFGVNHDLSNYDIESLSDPQGIEFLKNCYNLQAECPQFCNGIYVWVKVKILGFDKNSNKAIIIKQGQSKQIKVSRLSLKFGNKTKQYWTRINNAKTLRRNILQQIKYEGYVDSRLQYSDIFQLILSDQYSDAHKDSLIAKLPPNKQKIIQHECHNRYYKQFLIYHEMHINYTSFKQIGIDYRQFTPPKQSSSIKIFPDFENKRKQIQIFHYSSVKNMALTLRIIIKKIFEETKQSFFSQIIQENQCVDINTFVNCCKEATGKFVNRFIKQTREVLVSEIIHQTRYSFGAEERPVLKVPKANNKQLQKRYFRLCNYIFRTQTQTELFQKNCLHLSTYLSSFCTWSKSRLPPILTLSIQLKQKQKQFESIPNKNQTKQKLYSIFEHIKKCMDQIPDLTSDLLYEKQKYIKVQLVDVFYLILKNVVQYSFKLVEEYFEENRVFLRYLGNVGFVRGKFDRETVKQYRATLEQIVADHKKVLHQSLHHSGLFLINLTPCKTTLNNHILTNKSRILRQIQKQCLQQNQSMLKQLKKMQQEMKSRPDEEVSYVKMKKYVHVDCQNLIDDCKDKYQMTGLFYQLMEEFGYGYKSKEYEGVVESVAEIVGVQKRVGEKRVELLEIQKKLIEKINLQREEIEKIIEQAKVQIEVIVSFKKLQDYKDSFSQTSKLYFLLEQNRKKLENINFREELLMQEPSTFPWLGRLCRRLLPFFEMWKNIYYYKVDSQDWYELPVQELNFQDIKHKVNEIYKKQFARLAKLFNQAKNTDAFMICQAGNQLVKQIQEKFWLIDSFTKQGLLKKPNMMGNILTRVYGPDAPTNFRNVNLNDLLQHNAEESKQFIIETSNRAQKIWNLQKRVNSVILEMKNLYFQLIEKHDLTYIEPDLLLTLLSAARQQLSVMDIIKSEDEAVDILKRITTVHNKIETIADTLTVIDKFQLVFVRLYRVFLISEVINELGEQKRKINDVHRAWNTVNKHFNKDLQVWEAIDSDSYKYRLENCMKTLKQVEQALKKWMHNKRKIFPRLYFITDDLLIQMIADDKLTIQTCYLKYFFNGVIKFMIKSEQSSKKVQVIGLQGPFSDFIKLKRSINSSIIIWDRLNMIREQMIEAMKLECTPFGLANSNILIIKILQKIMSWTLKIEQCLKSPEKQKNSLSKLSQLYHKQQSQIKVPQFRPGEISKIHSWYTLKSISFILHQQIRSLSLIQMQETLTLTSFQYQKLVRVYLVSDKIHIKIMSCLLNLEYQYVGVDMLDVVGFFGAAGRNVHSVLALMRMYVGANGQGTGCFKAIQQIAALSLSHFVGYMIQGQDRINTADLLRGFYVQPIFGCIYTRKGCDLTIQNLSIISEVAYEVKQALIAKQYITILGTQTKWDFNRGFYNLGLHLEATISSASHTADYHLSTMKLCYRSINFYPIPWSKLCSYFLSQFCQSSDIIIRILPALSQILGNQSTGFEQNLESMLRQFLIDQIATFATNPNQKLTINEQNIIELLIKKVQKYTPQTIWIQFRNSIKKMVENEQQQQQNESKLQRTSTKMEQFTLVEFQSEVRDVIQILESMSYRDYQSRDVRMIAIVGPALSGKTFLIKSVLTHLQVPKQDIVESPSLHAFINSNPSQIPKYLVLHSLDSNTSFLSIHPQNEHYVHRLPQQTTFIYELTSLQHIGPNPLIIYNKKININWHKVLWSLLKINLSAHSAILQQLSRQMGIFVRCVLYGLIGCSGENHISQAWMWQKQKAEDKIIVGNEMQNYFILEQIFVRIIRNCVKVVTALVHEGRIIQSDLSSIRQAIFLSLLWTSKLDILQLIKIALSRQQKGIRQKLSQYQLISLSQKMAQNESLFWYFYLQNIQSSLLVKKNQNQNEESKITQSMVKRYMSLPDPYDLCYDIEKKAWIQWNVIEEISPYFKKSYNLYQQIYLPIKQTAPMLYLSQYLIKHSDFWLISQQVGSGASTIGKKITYNIANPVPKQKKQVTEPNSIESMKNEQATPKASKFIINQYFSFVSCSDKLIEAMIDKIYTSRSKDGSFNPYRNGQMNILIDDMSMLDYNNLPTNGRRQLLKILSILCTERMRVSSLRKLNNMRLMFISTGFDYYNTTNNNSLSDIERLHNHTVPLHMRPISEQSKQTIFVYILDWFFGNTDNPFSKQVRSMKDSLINLTLSLANKYELIQGPGFNQTHQQKQDIEMIHRWTTAKSNLKALRQVYQLVCQVNPRKVKRQIQILSVWAYQFNKHYPDIPALQYLKIYESQPTKKHPIPSKQLFNTISQTISKQDRQQSSHGLMHHSQFHLLSTWKTKQYNRYSFKEAEIIIVSTLRDTLQSVDRYGYSSNGFSFQDIVFYPQFIRDIVQDLRFVTSSSRGLLKISYPYTGSKTALKCAVFIGIGQDNIGYIDQNSKLGWKLDLIKFLGNRFYEYFNKNKNIDLDISKFILAFSIKEKPNPSYIEVLLEYLQNSESKCLIYIADQKTGDQIDNNFDEERQARTLLQCLQIHSNQSDKYKRYVNLCHNYLKSSILINHQHFPSLIRQYPSLLTYCSFINYIQPITSTQIQSIMNNSIGFMWTGLDLIQFLHKENQQQIINENSYSRKIMKAVKHVQLNVLSSLKFVWGNRKYRFMEWMKWTMKYYRRISVKLELRVKQIKELIQKKQEVQQDKGKLQKELASMIPKLDKIKAKNQQILTQVKQHEAVYLSKKKIHDDEAIKVKIKKQRTIQIQNQCEHELGKVTPILESAEQSLAKVTRDDINQLRSFPNPPLPAAKVVEALCFVFNEDHLVKEKVQNGNKFKDYWDYAKKFILNDRLLKRVTQFKPDFIKTMNKNKMQILKGIIRQQQFKEQRVFKASSAAGNLSVWMRAVVLTYEVMQVIDPKRKQLNQALQALKTAQQILSQMKLDMDTALAAYNKILSHYNDELVYQNELENKIQNLKAVIKRSEQFLGLLSKMQVKWEQQIEDRIPKMIEKGKIQALWLGLYVGVASSLGFSDRSFVKDKLAESMGTTPLMLSQINLIGDYQQILLKKNQKNQNNTEQAPNNEPTSIQNQTQLAQTEKRQQQKKKNTSCYNITSPYYAETLISTLQHIENNDKNLIIIDPTESLKDHLQSQLNNKNIKYVNIDCLTFQKQEDIYEKVSTNTLKNDEQLEEEDEDKQKIFLIHNLEQLSICQSFLSDCQHSQPGIQLIIISKYQLPASNNLIIVNNLCQQTKQSMLFSILCPITRENTYLFSKLTKYNHERSIVNFDNRMSQILLHTPNILLNDQAVRQWIQNYEGYWANVSTQINLRDNTAGEKQVVKGLSQSDYWQQFTYFYDFLELVKKTQKDPIFTLNQRMKQKFETDPKKKQNKIKYINNSEQNQLGLSQVPFLEEQQTLPFSPFQFVQLKLEQNGNEINEFIQKRKITKSSSNFTALSNSEQIYLIPSHQKVLQSLPFLVENQKQLVICCNTRFEGYKMHDKIKEFYDRFCRKMEEGDDDFLAENYGFKVHILITAESDILKDRSWRVEKSTQKSADRNDRQIRQPSLKSEISKISSSITKAQSKYWIRILQKNKEKYWNYKQYNKQIRQKQPEKEVTQIIKKWEDKLLQ